MDRYAIYNSFADAFKLPGTSMRLTRNPEKAERFKTSGAAHEVVASLLQEKPELFNHGMCVIKFE